MKINYRNCSICGKKIEYKNKTDQSYKQALKNNSNCKECASRKTFLKMNKEIKEGIRKNGFAGKKHKKETRDIIRNKITKCFEAGILNTKGKNNPMYGIKGENNPRFGKHFYEDWIEKYGKEEADIRLEKYKKKVSKNTRGKNNPMYGKPAPQGSGNGWSGWYKGWYFRSLRELSYMINVIERFNIEWKSAENIKIEYTDWKGNKRNYLPDFLLNEKYLMEIKPKKLWGSKNIILKRKAGEKYCKNNNLIYKLIDPILISKEKLLHLHDKGKIKFLPKYEEKLINYDYIN